MAIKSPLLTNIVKFICINLLILFISIYAFYLQPGTQGWIQTIRVSSGAPGRLSKIEILY